MRRKITLIHKNPYFTYNKIYAKTHAKEGIMKYLLGVITVVLILFLYCSLKVASICDKMEEEDFLKKETSL